MRYLMATLTPGPLLLLQGRRVRRVTPVLPGASGLAGRTIRLGRRCAC